ncbi:type I toxin-antitoxin system hok family toxin [Salmonella enterica]|nr:type I toxin-antitoxin system hok family toxin [Salmonella enterica]ECD6161879.1 type I toxin-antitoxin system hok family toxin [Salmonella enterica subsp. enterica]ECU7994973.1 type I toxin-antitoxin system hok family toxin [Salmonella enterica subsp. enterica serovar Toucra]EAW3045845.1 type I toxin-antitoxin system hok family toxin [Salmonella enterica]EAW3063885.1 type I toxin-antitoxin system hok family toxin [Salmonella enterica]
MIAGAVYLGSLVRNNKHLCDVSFRGGKAEIVAHMVYESR